MKVVSIWSIKHLFLLTQSFLYHQGKELPSTRKQIQMLYSFLRKASDIEVTIAT